MSRNMHSHKKEFILFPLFFMLVGYLIVALMFIPFKGTASSFANLLMFDTKIGKAPVKNIFSSAPATQSKSVKLSAINFPEYGDCFGQLSVSSASIKADLYFGDGADELKKGVGLYNGSFIPGYGKVVLIAGHNHTFFHTLGKIKENDKIIITTNYGTYTYQVIGTKVKDASDKTAYDLNSTKENLVLYTCYPFNCIGLTPQRYYVYADYLSGPKIDKQR